jgi:hypothetical protein
VTLAAFPPPPTSSCKFAHGPVADGHYLMQATLTVLVCVNGVFHLLNYQVVEHHVNT